MKRYIFITCLSILIIFMINMTVSKNPICDIVDNATIANNMMSEHFNNYKPEDWKMLSAPNAFFVSEDRHQIIFIEPYCDMYIYICYFHNWSIPKELIDGYDYPKDEIYNRIKKAPIVESKYLQTKKGAKLGIGLKEVWKIYGTPHHIEAIGEKCDIIRFKWETPGITMAEQDEKISEEEVCKDVLVKQEIFVDFKNDKIIAIHIKNDAI